MNSVTVRKATMQDLDSLLPFEQGVIAAERPFDETLRPGPIHYYDLNAMLQSETTEVAVALLNGQIVGSGYARLEIAKPYHRHSNYAYLGFMYVAPAHRGKGINAAIISYLKGWARAKGLTELRLEVYCENLPAIRAYAKMGFSKLLVEMRLSVDEEK